MAPPAPPIPTPLQRMNVSAYESRVCGLSENQKNVGSHQHVYIMQLVLFLPFSIRSEFNRTAAKVSSENLAGANLSLVVTVRMAYQINK